jgi:6-phosphogluconolactonase (cycloisomerase 2 family)
MAAGFLAAVGLGVTACSRDYTAAYVYTASASGGNINAFGVDFQSGILTQVNGSPFNDNFQSNTTIIASPDGKYVYAVSGPQDSKVEAFAVGTDGKLYGLTGGTVSLGGGGTYPTAATIDPTGKFLYVTFTYQVGYTPASPGPGGISIFPINADGSLGTPVTENGLGYVPVGNNPVGIAVSVGICSTTPIIAGNTSCNGSNGAGHENVFVYVVDQEASPNGTVLGFAQNTTDGSLTPLSGTTCGGTPTICHGYHAGVTPSAIVIDPTGRFVYVTDKTSNQVLGFSIDTSVSGNLTPLISGPQGTGLYPVALTIEPRGKYLYTANFNSGTVSSFAIDEGSGSLSGVAGSASFTTSTHPTCVTVEPALGIYLYTSDSLQGYVSAGKLNPNTGALTGIQNSPFPVSALPACITSVPNGLHSSQIDTP